MFSQTPKSFNIDAKKKIDAKTTQNSLGSWAYLD